MYNLSAFWIILTASFISCTGGLLGSFLTFRRGGMAPDSISHSVLPGIVLAYVIAGFSSPLLVIIIATFFGIFTTWLSEWIGNKGGAKKDASLGLVFTTLFAIGVLWISWLGDSVHLDAECVLFGEIAFVPLQPSQFKIGYYFIPLPTILTGLTFFVTVVIITTSYRSLLLTTFDEGFATVIGRNKSFWHYLIMTLTSIATVMFFESVGAILVVGCFAIPAATSYLISRSFKQMLLFSQLIAVSGSIAGYYAASHFDISISGSIVTVMGGVLGIVVIGKWLFITTQKNHDPLLLS